MLKLSYDAACFEAQNIERMMGHLEQVILGLVNQPQASLAHLPIVTPQEQKQILVDWNRTETDYPRDKTIHALFEEQVEKTPDHIALVFEEEQLTYRALNERANQVAHTLRARYEAIKHQAFAPDTLVALCVERSMEMVIGILGILKAGGAYVPLDPSYPKDRLQYMLADTQAPLLVTQARLLAQLPSYSGEIVCLDRDRAVLDQASGANPRPIASAQHLAYVIYTSGSTGQAERGDD